ncbi:MAG TPA: hypothetical protein VM008_04640 [Phycisphaerae bacterium]|nr:hypothetical protein [Phycisphaerae bacterium]
MTTFDTSSLGDLKRVQQELTARLRHFRRRVRMRLVVEGAAIVAAEVFGAAFLTFVIDHALRLGVAARVLMLMVVLAGIGYELWKRVVGPIRLRLGLVALAGAIPHRGDGGTKDLAALVASVLELPRLLESDNPPSAAMIDRAVRRCHESLAAVDFDASLDHERLKRMLGMMAASLVLPAVLIAVFPHASALWARRLFLASREPWPQYTYLEVADVHEGRIAVPRGEPYVLRARARDGSVAPSRIRLSIQAGDRTSVLMKEFGKNDFRHDFAVIDQPLTLELEGGDDDLGPIVMEPVDRPRITNLQLVSQHPRDAGPQSHAFTGTDADLSFLTKTKLTLTVAANVPLSELRLKAGSTHPTQSDLHPLDATHYAIEWTEESPAKFDLELVARDSGLVSLPVPISIGLKADQPPRVSLAYSGVHPRITPAAKIPLAIDARDDFGVIAASLALKDETPDPADPAKLLPHEGALSLYPPTAASQSAATQPIDPQPLLQLKQTVDVATMKLPAGALLSITALAIDDCYTGRQTSRSRTVTFRLVPPEELFREILQRQQAERIKFRKQMEEAEKIRDAIRVATDSRQIADLSRRHRAFQREVQRITAVLVESLTEMELNSLGSPESHTLMQNNVLFPLKALQDELIGPQISALDNLDPGDSAKVASAADRENQIADRMNTILKQMAQWDSFVDVLNQLDTIIKLETQVKDTSEKLRKKESEGLFDK